MALVLIGPGSVDQVRITVKCSFSDLDIKVLPTLLLFRKSVFLIIFRDKYNLLSIHFVNSLSTLLCSPYTILPVGTEL